MKKSNNSKSEKTNYNVTGSKADKATGKPNTQSWETPRSNRNER